MPQASGVNPAVCSHICKSPINYELQSLRRLGIPLSVTYCDSYLWPAKQPTVIVTTFAQKDWTPCRRTYWNLCFCGQRIRHTGCEKYSLYETRDMLWHKIPWQWNILRLITNTYWDFFLCLRILHTHTRARTQRFESYLLSSLGKIIMFYLKKKAVSFRNVVNCVCVSCKLIMVKILLCISDVSRDVFLNRQCKRNPC